MGDLRFNGVSTHFSRKEMQCRCGCGRGEPDPLTLYFIEKLRNEIGIPVYINSGGRCESHNANVGGSPKSEHLIWGLYHRAVDYRHKELKPLEECRWWEKEAKHRGGLGAYYRFVNGVLTPSFIHMDTGQYWRRNHPSLPRRWFYVDGKYLWLGEDLKGKTFLTVSHYELAQALEERGIIYG